jgi:glycosyltransferase involved in cell wall biosynthesis
VVHEGERIRVLFSHNYPMAEARAGWEHGVYPGHHLWGTVGLSGVADVVDVPFDPPASRLARWMRPRFGDLGQQWKMLRNRSRPAVWYSGDFRTVGALSLLRRSHLTRTPIIVVAHDVPAGRVDAACLRGADVILCISRRVARELVEQYGIDSSRIHVFAWGPDLAFAGYAAAGSEYVLSIGKTERDLPTLLEALARTGLPARVYADETLAAAWMRRAPNVEFRDPVPAASDGEPDMLSYQHVLSDLQRAAVFAVPLVSPHRPFGLTELDDALALGKPIVMTRNPYIDLDIEAVGCGIWIDEGDVDGWAAALERLMGAPELREEMGRRGREIAEREWHMGDLEDALRDAILTVSRAPGRD